MSPSNIMLFKAPSKKLQESKTHRWESLFMHFPAELKKRIHCVIALHAFSFGIFMRIKK